MIWIIAINGLALIGAAGVLRGCIAKLQRQCRMLRKQNQAMKEKCERRYDQFCKMRIERDQLQLAIDHQQRELGEEVSRLRQQLDIKDKLLSARKTKEKTA